MNKPLTATVTIDTDTAARIENRAGEIGVTPAQFVAELVRSEEGGDHVDSSVVEDLETRWAEVEAGGETIPHEDVRRWLKTWGTSDFKPWSKGR